MGRRVSRRALVGKGPRVGGLARGHPPSQKQAPRSATGRNHCMRRSGCADGMAVLAGDVGMIRRFIEWAYRKLNQHPPCKHQWVHLQTVSGLDVTYVLQCKNCGDLKKVKV